ncbi:hypothetical protein [Nitrosomonas communis]|uniref:hypothetical protein n=1 Tax=Nitrosomonas communis TaxID=44574 RepID=UPI003D27986A
MTKLHIKAKKKQTLIELLGKTDKRRNHSLYLCSCYFAPEAARGLIRELSKSINMSLINIYIDRKVAIEHGRKSLEEFCNSFADLKINLYAVETNILFHSKSYALVAFDESNNITSGSIVLGSANLTGAGLMKNGGNIECLIDSQDINLLEEHMAQLSKLKILPIDKLNDFSNKDEYSFKYALLRSGVFIHKWNDSLEQYLSIRYRLTREGKSRIGDHSFKRVGFNIETATISKRYFRFDYTPKHLKEAENVIRNFGIESYLGYWLPYVAVESMFDKKDLELFKERLFSDIERQRNVIEQQIQQDFSYLMNEGLIEEIEVNPVNLFNKKLVDLMTNELKLKRVYSKYEIFNLPYDVQQKNEILELFDELIEVAESKTRKNTAVKAFLASYATFSIERFSEVLDENLTLY